MPFRRPLTAIAPAPGEPVGVLSAEALAVGADGEAARYVPGQGWEPEFLLTASGKRATPTLRGVAWPEPGRAFAVGDGAAMWVWQKATGFWEPDPAEPPNLVRANFTGIAFDPGDPSRGYAVGKQGLLLGYGRTWTQEQLPAGIPAEANFTSIAFAGEEALATYKFPVNKNGVAAYTGGVLANDGSGWQVDQSAEAALGGAVPERVAGLPDGGSVIASEEGVAAGEGAVIEREGASAPWLPAPGGSPGYPAALAAIREGGQVRAIVSVAKGQGGEDLGEDSEQVFKQPPSGQAPLLSNPYPLPGSGLLLRQTATGWRDEQHQGYPLQQAVEGQTGYDLPLRPDPVLALLTSPDGSQGWRSAAKPGPSCGSRAKKCRPPACSASGPNRRPLPAMPRRPRSRPPPGRPTSRSAATPSARDPAPTSPAPVSALSAGWPRPSARRRGSRKCAPSSTRARVWRRRVRGPPNASAPYSARTPSPARRRPTRSGWA